MCGECAGACTVKSGEWLVRNEQSGLRNESRCGGRLRTLATAQARHVALKHLVVKSGGSGNFARTERHQVGSNAARLKRQRQIIKETRECMARRWCGGDQTELRE
jgi:sulfatase maturation enzyme AslB (radical SAM superfamily)